MKTQRSLLDRFEDAVRKEELARIAFTEATAELDAVREELTSAPAAKRRAPRSRSDASAKKGRRRGSKGTHGDKVRALLSDGEVWRLGEIAKKLKISQPHVSSTLIQLVKQKKVKKVGRGQYKAK